MWRFRNGNLDLLWVVISNLWAKVAFFFLFPGISLGVTHSLKIDKSVFFSEKVEKKNKCFLFFPRNSLWATHSKFFEAPIFLKKKFMFSLFFFSAHFWQDFCFFFFLEKFTFTHSLDWKTRFFFRDRKKNGFFTHSLDFCRKIPKNKLFLGKKKNATFAQITS